MKKALILLTSAVAMMALAAAPGCSGGGDDDDDDDDDGSGLNSGTYAVSGQSVTDGCGFYGATSYYDGVTEVDVTVSGVSVSISGFADDLSYDLSGTTLTDTVFGGVTPVDFTDNTSADYPLTSGLEYACKVDYESAYGGTVTGTNAFTLDDVYTMTITSGGGCTAALMSSAFGTTITAVPCETTDSVDLAL